MKKPLSRLNKTIRHACIALGVSLSTMANAKLPTATTSDSANKGDYVGLGKETAANVIEVVVMGVGAIAFVAGAWAIISKFMEVQNQKADWGDFGKTAVAGGATITIALVLLTQAGNIF